MNIVSAKRHVVIACGLLIAACASFSAQSALITQNGYTYDPTKNTVVGGGLEWLRWDFTIGQRYLDVLDDSQDGIINGIDFGTGWRIANQFDMAGLFNTFFGGNGVVFDTDETTRDEINTPYNASDDPVFDIQAGFIQLFGVTRLFGDVNLDRAEINSIAMYGLDLNGNNTVNIARVDEDYFIRSRDVGGRAFMDRESNLITSSVSVGGIALVRTVDTNVPNDPPTSVTAPETLGLFLASIMILACCRRQSVSK